MLMVILIPCLAYLNLQLRDVINSIHIIDMRLTIVETKLNFIKIP